MVDRIAHGPELSEVNSSVRFKQAKALPNVRTPDNAWHLPRSGLFVKELFFVTVIKMHIRNVHR